MGALKEPRSLSSVPIQMLLAYIHPDPALWKCPCCGKFTAPSLQHLEPTFCSYECVRVMKEIIVRRRRRTCLEKYGYEEPNHFPAIANRRNLRVRSVQQRNRKAIQNKKQETCFANWGYPHHTKHPFFREEIRKNNVKHRTGPKALETYFQKTGFVNPSKNPSVIEKILLTKKERYGTISGLIGRKPSSYSKARAVAVSETQLRLNTVQASCRIPAEFRGKPFRVGSKLEAELVSELETRSDIWKLHPSAKMPVFNLSLGQNYYPDFGLTYVSGKKAVVEVKSIFTLRNALPKIELIIKAMKKSDYVFVLSTSLKRKQWCHLVNPTLRQVVSLAFSTNA